MQIRHFFKLKPEKGKPLERVGRKTTDLNPVYEDMVASCQANPAPPICCALYG